MMTARERMREAFSTCGHVPVGVCRACVTRALVEYARDVRAEAARIAREHVCGCGDHGMEIARKIRAVRVE